MAVHDWLRVDAGIFHAFRQQWLIAISNALNAGILPTDYYALPEQHAAGFGPDVLTLQDSPEVNESKEEETASSSGGVLLAEPKIAVTAETDMEFYRRKQNSIAVRHVSGDRIVAIIEIVSPGNKTSRPAIRSFIEKTAEWLDRGIHLLILDLLPPGPRDPQGIHGAIWEEIAGQEYDLPVDKPLTLVGYETALIIRAYVQPSAVGEVLSEMPLFLRANGCVQVPLEATYNSAFSVMPQRWRRVLEGGKWTLSLLAPTPRVDYHRLRHFVHPFGRYCVMKQSLYAPSFVLCAIALLSVPIPSLRAADPLPPELNLIPRDSAMFISIRVADLWNNATLKPLRELAGTEGPLKDFEKENGFLPENVERLTILFPTFSDGGEPIGVITTTKPYDLAKVLDAWHGYTEAEAQQLQRDEERNRFEKAPFKRDPSFDKSPSKPEFKKYSEPKEPSKPSLKEFRKEEQKPFGRFEVSPLPREQNVAFFGQFKEEPRPFDKEPTPKAKERKRDLTARYYVLHRGFSSGLLIPIDDRTVVIAPRMGARDGGNIIALTTQLLRRQNEGPLSFALNLAAGKNTVVLGANVSMIRGLVESTRELKMLPIRSFLAAKSAAITYNLGDELSYQIVFDCEDASAAKKAKELLQAYMVIGREMLPGIAEAANREFQSKAVAKLFALFERAAEEATFEVKGSRAEMTLKMKADDVLMTAAVEALTVGAQKVREAAARAKDQNNLKQMVLAAHNYASAYNDRLPFGNDERNQKPKLSWRVTILPYIEQANLYNQFHLDEPWDSEHNKKLIPLMPKIYEIPGSNAPKGQTYYRAYDMLLGKYSIGNIPDGTSNTIMIFESAESGIWTKPDDLPLPNIKKMPKFGGRFKGGFNVAMCDGSVRFVSDKISPETLWAALTPDDGLVLGADW